MKWFVQALAYLLFAALIGVFTAEPKLRLLADDAAIISISFSHAAARIGECTRLTQEELLALPPNMRKADECPRERHLLDLELLLDGVSAYASTERPTGLWADGKATVYQRFTVAAGKYTITARMRDSGREDGFDYEDTASINLAPGQNLVVRFDATSGHFVFGENPDEIP